MRSFFWSFLKISIKNNILSNKNRQQTVVRKHRASRKKYQFTIYNENNGRNLVDFWKAVLNLAHKAEINTLEFEHSSNLNNFTVLHFPSNHSPILSRKTLWAGPAIRNNNDIQSFVTDIPGESGIRGPHGEPGHNGISSCSVFTLWGRMSCGPNITTIYQGLYQASHVDAFVVKMHLN